MFTYFSTFIPGTGKIVAEALKAKLKNVVITLQLEGLVVYRTPALPAAVRQLRFFNNSFVLFQLFKSSSLETMVRMVLQNKQLEKLVASQVSTKRTSFRIIASKENQFVSINQSMIRKLETRIGRIRRLYVHRSKPELEFWFLLRREGQGLFGMRITQHADYAKTLAKGELRPEVAHMLCLLSEPSRQDAFLDPLCGSGAIPIERARSFPYKAIIAGDNDAQAIVHLKQKIKMLRLPITAQRLDARHLSGYENGSINKIVTDPPWGFYGEKVFDAQTFYASILKEFSRVLERGGILILLTAQKELFEDLVNQHSKTLTLQEKYDILVSGKKASIYKLQRP